MSTDDSSRKKEKTGFSAVLNANAGVSITTPHSRIWVDALHDEHEETFSDVTPGIGQKMKKHPGFVNPDVIVFTHLHGDHFSRRLTEEAMRLYPCAKVILPSGTETFRRFEIGGDELYCIRTLHEGRAFTEELHEAVVIGSGEKRILLAGDMRIDEKTAEKLIRDMEENVSGPEEDGRLFGAVFAPFPWLTTTRGRRVMKEILRPERVILYHIPFAEDDRFGYRDAVRKMLCGPEREKEGLPADALMEPFSETEL